MKCKCGKTFPDYSAIRKHWKKCEAWQKAEREADHK